MSRHGIPNGIRINYPENRSGMIYSHASFEGASPKAAALAVVECLSIDLASCDGDKAIRKHANLVVHDMVRAYPQWADEINVAYVNAKRKAAGVLAAARPLDWATLEKRA